ncbi:glycosyltransferase [Flavobacteriaceae bacterium S0825]|uniref:glycosyltransferase n=1 Tax=Gaetbulibacter sp. S0825 TaxID=2720084 RepID=UPI001430850E|nr:glycosyltransferase [Gaetbulibacter sp. S0825]MCK0109041.1 glycosyltransferase [Flavobacteriaceae bacterium S0825]NIX64676.1 glycosyltransferase [Gaetbulibacter sp. S0825]
MRVLQLIDSLDAGGAERVAVNIANALSLNEGSNSCLCATRKEGLLKSSLDKNVAYLFLSKKSTFDISAIKRLNKFVKNKKIDIIHAHSTSFFLATLVRFLHPKVKIVWHDHYGNSEFLEKRKSKTLQFCSKYFSYSICVNNTLKDWSITHLKSANVAYLPNFAVKDDYKPLTFLKGVDGKRFLHLANLRPQKDHITLLKAFKEVVNECPECTLHCVGKNFDDDYSKLIIKNINELGLTDKVFLYGSKKDISNILNQSDICVLSSKSEGLPIALLEYGLAGKPVVTTNVGNCNQVIENGVNGVIVDKEVPELLAVGLLHVLKNEDKARIYGQQLQEKVKKLYSQETYLTKLKAIYNTVIDAEFK